MLEFGLGFGFGFGSSFTGSGSGSELLWSLLMASNKRLPNIVSESSNSESEEIYPKGGLSALVVALTGFDTGFETCFEIGSSIDSSSESASASALLPIKPRQILEPQ